MPAADGKPMLWPTRLTYSVPTYGYQLEVDRYGFVDVSGALVVPERYDGYEYCPDAAGRTAFVLAFPPGGRVDVLGLTGKRIARMPTESADCGGADHVIVMDVIDGESGLVNSGLFDLATKKLVLPVKTNRRIEVVDAHTLNVSAARGEFFYDLATGKRTPHAGWLLAAGLEPDAPAAPAAAAWAETYPDTDAGVGFVDRSGSWVVQPNLTDADEFTSGYAVIQEFGHYTFLDADLARVGGEWDEVVTVAVRSGDRYPTVGYEVTRGAEEGLLGPDLSVIVPPGPVAIECPSEAEDVCSIVAADGSAELIALPEGTRTPMPAGFTQALSRAFVADQDSPDRTDAARVYSLVAAKAFELPHPATCTGVGTLWARCGQDWESVSPVVVDRHGNRAPFRSIEAVADPAPGAEGAYYWVTAGRYQGFVDAEGAWRYQESRFTQLED